MIATASLLVAIVALHYYIESAREQQIALESSRRALETMVSSAKTQQEVLDASSGTLEGMLAMSKLQGQSMKEQQALVEESVRASKKQLSIIQEQYEVERKRPDVRIFNVHRVFSGDDLSVALRNVSSKVARDITLKGFFTILRAEPFAVPVKIWDINYLRAGDVRSQWLEIDFPKGVEPLKKGERIFGFVDVRCPDCEAARECWIYYQVGGNGWYTEREKKPFATPHAAHGTDFGVFGPMDAFVERFMSLNPYQERFSIVGMDHLYPKGKQDFPDLIP